MHKKFTLAELAQITNSKLIGDSKLCITNVADLESARGEDASFLGNPRYEQAMRKSQAGVIFVHSGNLAIEGRNFLINENPSRAFQQTMELFVDKDAGISGFQGIHPSAIIHETAKIGKQVSIGPHVVIDKDVVIGDRTVIQASCSIGPSSKIGEDCFLHPHVVIRELCILGNRVILQPGVIIGSCGFGYTPDSAGRHIKLNQIGSVVLEDDVEIGANSTIDRARFKDTRIGKGTKIDNLVQIAHGVKVGEHNIIVAQSGIAGSTETGRHVMIGGQVAVNGHIKLADGVMISAKSGVSKSLTEAGKYGGVPVTPLSEYNRNSVYLRNIESFIDEIKTLKRRLEELELTKPE